MLLDPAENYEDNDRDYGDLKRGVIKVRLATLIGGFPNGSPSDPDVFVRVMLEHICSVEGFCLPALDAACYEIVATQKFLPTISELLKTLNDQQTKMERRLWAISSLADQSRRTVAKIEALQVEAQQAAKARAVDQAQQNLDHAREEHQQALAELAERQEMVASSQAWLALCEAEVLKREQALAEAVKRSDDTNE